MNEKAVVDTGTVIHLAEIEQEDCLKLFESVALSQQVADELARHNLLAKISSILHDRLSIQNVTDGEIASKRGALASCRLHKADISVVVLASRWNPEVVSTDDLDLRRALEQQGFTVVGSVGLIVRAREKGRISEADFHISLERLLDGSSLYLSKSFRNYIRKLLQE